VALAIREATVRDYDALCIVVEEVDRAHRHALPDRFQASAGPARSREYIVDAVQADDVGLFVAEIGEQVVGLVHTILKNTPALTVLVPRRYAVVDNLCVLPAHRRCGVGRALLTAAEGWAGSRGATSIELTVYAFNQPACDFYTELGFCILSHRLTKPLGAPESESLRCA